MADAVSEGQRWQHVKRGTEYEIVGIAELQAGQPQCEHAALAIYRGEDGKLWARNTGEFTDGRFVLASTQPAPAPNDDLRAALELARPIIEADLATAESFNDSDWEGLSRTALEAVDKALAALPQENRGG